jgi:tetratricopeptide (TPR) repeat protein
LGVPAERGEYFLPLALVERVVKLLPTGKFDLFAQLNALCRPMTEKRAASRTRPQSYEPLMRLMPWLACLIFAGCQSYGPRELAALPTASSGLARFLPKAIRLPTNSDDPLLPQASQALERGDHAQACELLRSYAERHPESKHARAFYAEVLAKLGKGAEASVEFEKAIARLQAEKTIDLALIVHCHGRLIDLADEDADEFHVHLHRGLGLYWLAQQKRHGDEPPDAPTTESILCKAALELTTAHAIVPGESRPTWYLYLIWRQLGQTAAAQRWLRETQITSPYSYLTPHEQSDLYRRAQN